VFERFFEEALRSGGALTVHTAAGEIVGSSRFHGYDEQRSEVEIGWTFLARAYWGGQANRELKQLMLDHAFLFVERVVFLVGTENRRSQRALEKIRATPAGTRRDGSGQESLLF
jgi:N-acetyltransferase